MNEADLKDLLDAVSKGKLDTKEAMSRLRNIPASTGDETEEKILDESAAHLDESLSQEKETRKYTPEAPKKTEPPSPPASSEESEEELGKFSETSWFMAAPELEELSQDTEKVKIDEEKYRPDAELEAEIRKKFSLRESDDSES